MSKRNGFEIINVFSINVEKKYTFVGAIFFATKRVWNCGNSTLGFSVIGWYVQTKVYGILDVMVWNKVPQVI